MNTEEKYNEVSRIRKEVERLNLDGKYIVLIMPIDSLCAAYNGTGPEFLPETIRHKLDEICNPFLPAVMVHDVNFTNSDGSLSSFDAANNRILSNCITCAMDAHPWNSWKRYALIIEAFAIYRACHKFGWTAWLSAYRKNTNRE